MKRIILSVILILLLFLSSCSPAFLNDKHLPRNGEAVFHFIDVGQGDCTLIQTADSVILIDAGTSESGSDTVRYIKNLGIKKIDCAIFTHPHEDHMGGAASIIKAFKINNIHINKDASSSFFYEKFIDAIEYKDIVPTFPNLDCVYEYGNLRIKFISPHKDYEDDNDNSIITVAEYGDKRFLFMGDAGENVEHDLLDEYDLNADVLKVGHHGSRESSSMKFLAEVLPGICVIPCGTGNSYGHPHKEAVDRINKTGSLILRTDEKGTIRLKTDGTKIYNPDGKEYIYDIKPLEFTYIGNKKSHTFHTDMCQSLPAKQNRIIFDDRVSALNAGYNPCRNCKP